MLPTLANTLGVTVEDLIGAPARRCIGNWGPAPKLLLQLERIQHLAKTWQRAIV
ncbi:hypothetical protein NYR97_09645 [Xanthomonas hydrangeae]|uniref:HTH cro/C1-type domain-containing protein n=1 Tax=Xanthomonas hydrangeae TaxID=2775159 RepID=A0AAU0BFB3_9XANT|nr:hypothetical protein [Xanthomonas hydrangeae]WOB51582.1 hypothetical protein NYR97_09645 [Xanthomonas hydrangeae]